jgi:hypothetical protein
MFLNHWLIVFGYGRRTSFPLDVTVIVERRNLNATVMFIYSKAEPASAASSDGLMHAFSLHEASLLHVTKHFASEMSLAGICDGP